MKIGLVRHFKVNHPFPKKRLVSKPEVLQWFAEYDSTARLEYKTVDLGDTNWQRCYSSPMMRAVKTAHHIYKGEIIEVTALKELDILNRLSNRPKLPFLVWGLIVRIKSFSSNADTDKFKNGITSFIDKIVAGNETDVLIVSHWFVMRAIQKELIKRGLTGSRFKSNEYGVLYVYESQHANTVSQ